MKNKLFCCLIGCFLIGSICEGTPVDKNKETYEAMKQRMAEVEAYNAAQKKNHLKLSDYQKKHSDLVEAKKEDYWDLAWHARLADYGDPQSQFIIAMAYEKGDGVAPDPKKAVSFYKKAAEQGHLESCMKLGSIYLENKWIQKDEEKALYWYLKAGKQGYTQAQFKVAEIYEAQGKYEAAYKWTEAALKQIFPDKLNLEEYSPALKKLGVKIAAEKNKTFFNQQEQKDKSK